MTTDIQRPATATPGPVVYVMGDPAFFHPDASGVICDADIATDTAEDNQHVIWRIAQGTPPPPGASLCVADGLDAAAALAVEAPKLAIIPRAEVRRVAPRYGFSVGNGGSGFSTYQLDPASVGAFTVSESGRNEPLGDWLEHATTLGFYEVWLHGIEADEAGLGFPCGLLAKAHRIAPDMRFWMSGGGRVPAHVATITKMPGLAALIIEADVLSGLEPGEVIAALALSEPVQGRGAA
jgi:hypothetical protein